MLSVLFGECATVKNLMQISPEQFHPRPKVESVVVKITFQPRVEQDYNSELLVKLVKTGFQKRRKTLINCLAASPLLSLSKEQAGRALQETGLPETIRGEALTIADYIRLTKVVEGLL